MANIIVCHPNGSDLNGGGYTSNYEGTWAEWHNNFSVVSSYSGGTVTQNAGKVRITCGTNLSVYPKEGMLVYCEFQTYYSAGHYEVIGLEDGDYFDIDLTYAGDDSASTVNVGGALKTPSVASLLAYDDIGSKLLLPANQTTQTVNEVDGNANQILLVTQGYTCEINGVNDTTGELLSDDDLFPKIMAKSGSTWAANSSLFYMQSNSGDDLVATTTLKLDKIILDGNSLAPIVLQTGDNLNDYICCEWGTVEIINSASSGFGWYSQCYMSFTGLEQIRSLYIDNCGCGFYPLGSRTSPKIRYLHINNCSIAGLYGYLSNLHSALSAAMIYQLILSNNAVGLNSNRYNFIMAYRTTFVNNVIDLKFYRYSTESVTKIISNCLFYNDNTAGKIVLVDDSTHVTVKFENCVLGVANGAVIDSGATSTKTNCNYITSDVFMDKTNGDYRLNPNAVEFDKVYDWTTGEFYGALGPAFPTNGGNGDSYIVYEEGELRFYVNGILIRSYS